mmetsp:Transcript_5316/g.15245  ORF Transcript_5316/g.15245 Transcript_5316/m.15245 type:complete len:245 (+) Transcript_5316:453-1187(+)
MFPPATPALTPIAVKRTVLEQVKGSHPFIDRETDHVPVGLKSPRAAVVPLTSLATSPRSRSHLRAASLPIICETGPTPLDSPLWGLPRVSASADYSLCSDRKAAAAFADLLKASKQHSTTKQAGASPQVDVAQLRQQHPFPVSHSQKPTQFQAQELSQDQMQSEDQQAPGAIRTQSLRGGRVSSGSDSDSCSDSSSDKPESPTRPSSLKALMGKMLRGGSCASQQVQRDPTRQQMGCGRLGGIF